MHNNTQSVTSTTVHSTGACTYKRKYHRLVFSPHYTKHVCTSGWSMCISYPMASEVYIRITEDTST